MKQKKTIKVLMIVILIFSATLSAQDEENKFNFEIQGAGVWQIYNDIQIPNDNSGSRIALDDVVGKGMFSAFRVSASWQLNPDTQFELVLAPFLAEEDGTLEDVVFYNEKQFNPGNVLATYKFNTYRLSYRYTFHQTAKWTARIGATLLIRDADVALEQGPVKTNYDNLGFVPLLNFNSNYKINDSLEFIFDFNGLAGGPGRLLEADLRINYSLSNNSYLGIGYRALEGGVDIDDVYNFAMLHGGYLALGIDF